ncbi:hypothetical protein ACMHYB_35800 [Sorangium sp. So ce1128]
MGAETGLSPVETGAAEGRKRFVNTDCCSWEAVEALRGQLPNERFDRLLQETRRATNPERLTGAKWLLGVTLFLVGSLFLPLATNSLLYSLHVIFTPFLLWAALRQAPGARRGLIAIWAFVGVAIYFHDGFLTYQALHGYRWLALLLPLAAAFLMSLVNLSADRLQHIPFEYILLFTALVGIVASFLALVTTGSGAMILGGSLWSSWDQLVLSAGAGAAARFCIVLGLTSGSLLAAVITEALTVVFTGIAGLLFLRESISPAQRLGMLIILSAIVLINLSNRSPQPGEPG